MGTFAFSLLPTDQKILYVFFCILIMSLQAAVEQIALYREQIHMRNWISWNPSATLDAFHNELRHYRNVERDNHKDERSRSPNRDCCNR